MVLSLLLFISKIIYLIFSYSLHWLLKQLQPSWFWHTDAGISFHSSPLSPKVLWFLQVGFYILQASFWGVTRGVLCNVSWDLDQPIFGIIISDCLRSIHKLLRIVTEGERWWIDLREWVGNWGLFICFQECAQTISKTYK